MCVNEQCWGNQTDSIYTTREPMVNPDKGPAKMKWVVGTLSDQFSIGGVVEDSLGFWDIQCRPEFNGFGYVNSVCVIDFGFVTSSSTNKFDEHTYWPVGQQQNIIERRESHVLFRDVRGFSPDPTLSQWNVDITWIGVLPKSLVVFLSFTEVLLLSNFELSSNTCIVSQQIENQSYWWQMFIEKMNGLWIVHHRSVLRNLCFKHTCKKCDIWVSDQRSSQLNGRSPPPNCHSSTHRWLNHNCSITIPAPQFRSNICQLWHQLRQGSSQEQIHS